MSTAKHTRSSGSATVHRSRRARRGYTVVEILSAMTLFAIGAAGVIGMQRVTIQGGADARNFDMATNIAREWQHRLQRDALAWTEPNSVVSTSNIDNTLWLKTANIDGVWHAPVPSPGPQIAGNSAAFDLLGHDVDPGSADRIFCVQYRLGWITPMSATNPTLTSLIRAEIRVFWARLEHATPVCADITVSDVANRHRYHFVHVTTAVRGNPTQ
jgi:prepilin-type N-terminal cleavage/methylation domain-containing protein